MKTLQQFVNESAANIEDVAEEIDKIATIDKQYKFALKHGLVHADKTLWTKMRSGTLTMLLAEWLMSQNKNVNDPAKIAQYINK